MQCSLIQELMLYMFERGHSTTEATKNICCAKGEGAVNVLVPFQQLLGGPMEFLLCERVNDFRHSLFHHLNCLIKTASGLKE